MCFLFQVKFNFIDYIYSEIKLVHVIVLYSIYDIHHRSIFEVLDHAMHLLSRSRIMFRSLLLSRDTILLTSACEGKIVHVSQVQRGLRVSYVFGDIDIQSLQFSCHLYSDLSGFSKAVSLFKTMVQTFLSSLTVYRQ